jgi:hypothetical protein
MFQDYDVETHLKYKKIMVFCFVGMVGCWLACWIISWQAAVVALFANLWFIAGLFWAFKLYPPKKELHEHRM